jgi:DNA-directed RNA polymerase subunit H
MKKKIDISKHILVPKHIKISEKEKEVLFARYNISIKELPKIFKNDPAIKSLNAKPGDIIKIIRKSPTAGESIFYRGVINA